jgi:hypothetical protein
MKIINWFRISLFVLISVFSLNPNASALLIDRGGGLIYDTGLDITWLQDANYAQTSGYDIDGLMLWDEAMTWVESLSYYDPVRGITYTDWRLPTIPSSVIPFSFTSEGEMGHLHYTAPPDGLGNPAGAGVFNTGPFDNLQPVDYWTDTAYGTDDAMVFQFRNGFYYDHTVYGVNSAWAVRDGDVAPVPEPSTMLLVGTGLIGLVGFRKKFKK